MADVVAIDATGCDRFVSQLQQLWDQGAAVVPVDPRLPPPQRRRLFERLAPTAELSPTGNLHRLSGGQPGQPGDALIVATSGTTGDPKGVVLTHGALAASAAATNAALGVDPAADRWLACLPLAHMGGLGVIVRALASGTPLSVAPTPDTTTIADGLKAGCTRTALVATVLDRVDTSGFTTVLLGGGPAPRGLARNVVATYGMTETAGGVVYDGTPLEGVEVDTTGGIIRLRCPMLARAYRNGPEGETLLCDDDGWFTTGDAGTLDDTGALSVAGRVGDMIVTGGEKVWPAGVEPVLATHEGVADVAVVGRPDPTWGETVVALVVPTDPRNPPTIDELRAHVRVSLPPWAAPRRVHFVDSLPKTPLGKVVRAELGAVAAQFDSGDLPDI